MSTNVFVEKYRPTKFDDIVLDPLNKIILKNIISTGYFPNLLLYGPPGTGKTTTIINLISSFQEKYCQQSKELMIHLNASDERGVDIIRTQINQFVSSKTLFSNGTKFVILDEVDYMTKNAQQALRYLLQNNTNNVRFCLICNYISKIDEGLQNEFLRLRFNQLPEQDIIKFLDYISKSENLNLTTKSLKMIQQLYKSDIRSMINFMQSNQNIDFSNYKIIDESIWLHLFNMIKSDTDINLLVKYINETSINYNLDNKNIIKDFLNYIMRKHSDVISSDILNFIENIMHFEDCNNNYFVNYSLLKLSSLL